MTLNELNKQSISSTFEVFQEPTKKEQLFKFPTEIPVRTHLYEYL